MAKTFNELLQKNLNLFKQNLNDFGYNIDFNQETGKVLYAFINCVTHIEYNNNRNDENLYKQFFPQTANEIALKEFHGNTWGVYPLTKTPATGYVIFQGSVGASIPQGTQLTSSGKTYATDNATVITENIIKVKSISYSQGKATVTLVQDFKMASGMTIRSIYGAEQEEFNVENFTITAISTDSFIYDVESTHSNITGDIYVNIISASVSVTSIEGGSDQNLINGTELTMSVPRNDVSETCYVYYDGITGGKDEQDVESYRNSILEITRGIPQGWNEANIKIQIKTYQYGKYFDALIFIPRAEDINGVSKSLYTTIYILKSDYTVLSNTELQDLKDYLRSTIYRLNDVIDQFNVVSPQLKTVTLDVFLNENSNTVDMKTAIQETIADMQKDSSLCYFRTDIPKRSLEEWLDTVIDSDGNTLKNNYTLVSPAGDTTLAYNEYPILLLNIGA